MKRVWLWALCALVICVSGAEAQVVITSTGQFKELVRRVSRELPAGDMQCQKRRQIVEHHILGAKLQMDAASAQRINDWRTGLRAMLTHCRLEQWQAHFAGIDQSLGQEVRKGGDEKDTPLGVIPPLIVTETVSTPSEPYPFTQEPLPPVRIESDFPWGPVLTIAGATIVVGAAAYCIVANNKPGMLECDGERDRGKVVQETTVIVQKGMVGVRLPFGW